MGKWFNNQNKPNLNLSKLLQEQIE